jgi:hypothetical protein
VNGICVFASFHQNAKKNPYSYNTKANNSVFMQISLVVVTNRTAWWQGEAPMLRSALKSGSSP